MAVVKTYNVIVNVGVNTKDTAKGNAELKRNLQSYEREVSDSRKRMQADEQRFLNDKRRKEQLETQINQDEAIRRFNNKQRDIQQKQQLYDEARKKEEFQQKQHLASMAENDRIALAQKRQRAAQSDKERLKEALKAHQDVENLITNSALKDLGKHKGQSRDANKVLDFSKKTIDAEMANIDKIIKGQRITDANRILDSWTKKTRESTQSMGMWGQAFKGAFIGAIAGMSFSLLISGITTLIQTVAQLGIAGVKAAGDFEVTTNALAAFTGSTRSARKELAEMGQIALTTPGLRLEAAQQGFQRLRALGFEAQQAKAFIKELGEEKILSGASDEALDKIIFNFAQISSGGQKVSQELREILTQMPSLRNGFMDAFGTLDPKKIQAFFDADNDGAFKRLTDAMANQQAAAGGLNDSWGKLSDQAIKAGREFGEPFLKPVTRDLQDLTKFLRENADAWKSAGQELADYYNGLSILTRSIDGESSFWGFVSGAAESTLDRQSNGIYSKVKEAMGAIKELGRLQREMTEYANASPTDKTRLRAKSVLGGAFTDGVLPSDQDIIDSQNEAKKTLLNTESDIVEGVQKATQQRLEIIRDFNAEKISMIESANRRELALIDSQVTNTLEQEIEIVNRRSQILNQGLRQQYQEYQNYYAELIQLNDGNAVEIQKLSLERNQKIRGLNDQIFENELKRQKDVAEKQRQIEEKRRQDTIASLDLLGREYKQSYDTRVFDLERAIDRETISAKDGYDQLIQISQDGLEFETKRIRDEYALRLQDKKLTNQEIINLERERDLAVSELEINAQRRQQEIEDKRREAFIKNLTFQKEVMQSYLQDLSSIASTFQDNFFSPEKFSNSRLALFQRTVSQTGARDLIEKDLNDGHKKLESLVEKWGKYQDLLRELNGFGGADNAEQRATWDMFEKNYADQVKSNEGLQKELDKLNEKIPRNYLEFEKLAKQIQGGNIKAFDDLSAAILKHRQALDRNDAQSEVDYYETLLESETNAAKASEYRFNLQRAQRRLERVDYNQAAEAADQYANSLQGLRDRIKEIQSGDTVGLKYQAQQQILKEQISSYGEIILLQERLANSPYLDSLAIEKAQLEDIIALRNQETDAVIRINRAKLAIANQTVYSPNQDRANVLEFLAQQKGITEIVSDAKINSITLAYQGLDKVAQSIAKSFGAAKDSVSQFISSLLKLALNKLFQKLFGINADGTSVNIGGGNGKGFSLFGNGRVTQTPNYNPNASNFSAGAFANYYHQISSGGNSNATNFSGANSASPFQIFADALNGGSGTRTRAVGEPVEGGFKFPGLGLLKPGKENGANTQTPSNVRGGITGLIGSLLPILGGSLGSSLGQGNTGASLLGSIGGLAGGLAAGIGTGLIGTGATAGFSVFGTVLSATAATGILAAIAAPALLGAFFWGRNARRRKEEKLRNTAMADAFKQLDKLIEDVNADRIDGASAIEQAEQIRANYVEQMNQLKDKKTRSHALKDVSRIDAKISELKSAVAGQKSRRERLELFAPTFADGGSVSSFGRNNFRNNPLGYQQGGRGTSRSDSMVGYFPRSNSYARFSNSEYILDAETTSRIGVHNLDLMRQTKGASFNSMLARTQGRAFGGAVGQTMTPIVATPTAQTSSQPIEVLIHVDGSAFGQIIAQAISVAIKSNDGSTSQMNELKKSIENEGQNGLVQAIAQAVKLQLNIR